MPSWSPSDYADYIQRRQASYQRVRAAEPQPTQGDTLECALPRKAKSSSGPAVSTEPRRRHRITFRVYAVRPCDYDGYHIKELQDMCIKAGLLAGDEWDILQGEVISEKVHKKEQERTEIEIEPVA